MTSGTIDNVVYIRHGHSDSSMNNQVYLLGGKISWDVYKNDL